MRERYAHFLTKLGLGVKLNADDRAMLVSLCTPPRQVEAGIDLVDEGGSRSSLILLLSGWACRYRMLANGNRQIMGLLLPGDLSQPFGVVPRKWSCSLMALTPVSVCELSSRSLRSLAMSHPAIEDALWFDLNLERDLTCELLLSLGRRTATERLASTICEIYFRLKVIGLTDGLSFDLPVTQPDLADLLGLSAVHVNRSLMELRRRKLVTWNRRRFEILSLRELLDVAQFEPVDSVSLLSDDKGLAHG